MSQDCMEELIFILTLVAFFFNCGGENHHHIYKMSLVNMDNFSCNLI